ncbi:hypothetical protein [Allorhizocola rhizosphaerae]|uniref:hypothetical protein n=1 Tax=Allorhizocola rhizosphaerae TaxID=1872709 RepID=UPI0013C3625D|nr:hypothetical protein [Allorhizocola rhizosphaerae]
MAIRRKPPGPKPVEVSLGFLVLGYSELTSLMDLLASRAEGVNVTAGEKKISKVSDLYSATSADRKALCIKTDSPGTTIWLSAGGARVEVADGSSKGVELAEEIRANLEGCRQKHPVATVASIYYGLLAILVGTLIVFVTSVFTRSITGIVATAGMVLFALIGVLGLGRAVLSSGAVKLRLGTGPSDVEKVPLRDAGWLPEHVTAFRLGFVRLYLDDLDDIVRSLSERGKPVFLRADDAELDSINDLRNATSKELGGLIIGSRKPRVFVEIRRRQAFVYAMERSDKAISLADDVARLVGRRGTRFPVGHQYVLVFVAFSLGVLAFAPTIFWSDVSIIERVGVMAVALLLPVYSVSLYFGVRNRGGAKIHRTDRAGRIDIRRSWLQMWIGAVIGALVSLVLTWWQMRG